MKKITFFNMFHNGDIHVSRELVKIIMNKVNQIDSKITFSYAHSNDPCLLADIPNLTYESLNGLNLDQFENLKTRGDTVFINTWFAQQQFKYMNVYGISLDCLYAALNDTCKDLFQFQIEDIWPDPNYYIPTIDYSKFEIKNIDDYLAASPFKKKVLVANGYSMSGQAQNFNMIPIILDVAKNHLDTIFFMTNDEKDLPEGIVYPSNVVFSKDIIRKARGSDLNENSYLSNFCDLIIGRASGVYSYAWTQANVLERKAKFVAFCNPGVLTQKDYPFWTHELFHDKIKYTAKFFEYPTGHVPEIKGIIEHHLK